MSQRSKQSTSSRAPSDWRKWLADLFPQYAAAPFGPHHADFWDWVWSIEPGLYVPPFVAIWPRGGAKSTSAELAIAALAGRQARKYALYICSTQEQADDHVMNVAAMLESDRFSGHYAEASARLVGKYGSSRGWRRNRLRTSSGFTLDAIGLDTAARGIKIEEDRPDLIILDDLDEVLDGIDSVEKKIVTLTQSLLPTGSADAAVLAVQNLIHSGGIFAKLASGEADFLADRIVSGPFPAIRNLMYETMGQRTVITGGEPIWEGQDLAACQRFVDRDGISAFLIECQHEVDRFDQGMYAAIEFKRCDPKAVPPLIRIVVWVDPAVTDRANSDSHGIQADGMGSDGIVYRLYSWEQRTSPEDTIRRALLKAVELKAECVGVETDQGGDTWGIVYEKVWRDLVASPAVLEITGETHRPAFREEKAGAGFGPKAHRQQQMLMDYERGSIVHVMDEQGGVVNLERALKRFPVRKPYDLADAAFWSWWDLVKNRAPAQQQYDPPQVDERQRHRMWR